MNDRLLFFIRENLPDDNRPIKKEDLVENVIQDMLSVGSSVNVDDVFATLSVLHDKQHIFMFSSGFVSITRHGECNWNKK